MAETAHVGCLDRTREATPRQRKPGGDIPLGDARRRAVPHGTDSNSVRHALPVVALRTFLRGLTRGTVMYVVGNSVDHGLVLH